MDDSAPLSAFPRAPEAIELRHLRSFVAVAEELNFGRAAERLYLSQPALSRQISALERLVGCELLRRSTHRVELTPAGDALLDRARQLLEGVDEAVSATQSAGGELATRVANLWAPLVDVTGTTDSELETMRVEFEQVHARFTPPADVAVKAVNVNGVPAFELTPPPEPRAAELLYLHGGGYVMGSAYGFRHLAGALAASAATGALVPEYRLAPEHPYPAALEDAFRAYRWMVERSEDPRRLAIAGDSVGAGLALTLLLLAREEGVPLPGALVLFCPHVDLTGGTLEHLPDEPDVNVVRRVFRRFVDAYLAGHPIDDPLLNPLTADLSGLPPMLIQAASGDHVVADAHRLADYARSQGVQAELELYPGTTHAFQMFWTFLPDAVTALHQAGAFIAAQRSQLATGL